MTQRSELERRQRFSARLALYGSLVLTLLVGYSVARSTRQVLARVQVLSAQGQAWNDVIWSDLEEVRLFQGYLQVDTNSETGSEIAGARYLAEILERAGLEVHLEALGDNKANLWAILEGEQKGAVVLHNHIDVEPARQLDKWKFPPFSGHIEKPWIYGRGAFDMKSLAIAQVAAVLDLARSGRRPKRSVIFLATGSEEVGSDLGALWMIRQHPELVSRFEVVLTEGGVVEAVDRDTIKYWGISYGQKRFYDLVVCDADRGRLEALLRDLRPHLREQGTTDLRLVPALQDMLLPYAPTRQLERLRQTLEDPERVLWDEPAFRRLPDYLKAMFRNEAYLFKVQEAAGGGFEIRVKLHLLPGENLEEVRKELIPDWQLHGLSWTLAQPPMADGVSSTRSADFRTIQQVLQEHDPKAPVGPFFLSRTATDARFFRRLGIPSYGVSPFLILTPDTMTGNNPNERVALPGFVSGVAVYQDLVKRLAG
jgi:acetylornithine deacetylase/succinyl-diaminopimelate desuccinylase-like protein